MLHAIYCISFLCLLRSDEALHIQVHELVPEWDKKRLRLTLPFRKTDQYGGELCHSAILKIATKLSHLISRDQSVLSVRDEGSEVAVPCSCGCNVPHFIRSCEAEGISLPKDQGQ
jgi:hypothetical protein